MNSNSFPFWMRLVFFIFFRPQISNICLYLLMHICTVFHNNMKLLFFWLSKMIQQWKHSKLKYAITCLCSIKKVFFIGPAKVWKLSKDEPWFSHSNVMFPLQNLQHSTEFYEMFFFQKQIPSDFLVIVFLITNPWNKQVKI